ncbi:MAG TPA: 5,6-dimethylbenzimidazole synthase [Candidatus Binataceae bacterium]|nr:5,6-dimethylbenzimidazole synthase [Candidatus Binataceae bacterium]
MKVNLSAKPKSTRERDRDAFAPAARHGLYEAIFRRRDVRAFRPDPIPDAVLARVLVAAHHAPSVGFTQPWDFIIVRDLERRRAVKRLFEEERIKNAAQFSGARREKFLALKLEGIIEAPLNIIVTCERERFGPGVLGKTGIADVELYSTCLAVGNLWLAARAEGLGVGWVSILRNREAQAHLRHSAQDRSGRVSLRRLREVLPAPADPRNRGMGPAHTPATPAPFRVVARRGRGSEQRDRADGAPIRYLAKYLPAHQLTAPLRRHFAFAFASKHHRQRRGPTTDPRAAD